MSSPPQFWASRFSADGLRAVPDRYKLTFVTNLEEVIGQLGTKLTDYVPLLFTLVVGILVEAGERVAEVRDDSERR